VPADGLLTDVEAVPDDSTGLDVDDSAGLYVERVGTQDDGWWTVP
jgi:hypothetical protein